MMHSDMYIYVYILSNLQNFRGKYRFRDFIFSRGEFLISRPSEKNVVVSLLEGIDDHELNFLHGFVLVNYSSTRKEKSFKNQKYYGTIIICVDYIPFWCN
jgi:hypothetical protein